MFLCMVLSSFRVMPVACIRHAALIGIRSLKNRRPKRHKTNSQNMYSQDVLEFPYFDLANSTHSQVCFCFKHRHANDNGPLRGADPGFVRVMAVPFLNHPQ